MKTVDVDALVKKIRDEVPLKNFCGRNVETAYKNMSYIVTLVKEFPAVDAEPIVRCKDCKHWEEDWTPEAHTGHYCPQIDSFSIAEFYCADGEAKEPEA